VGLFQAITQWQEQRQERQIQSMQEKGLCPDCNGKGFNIPISEFYITPSYYDCPGCNGSGNYTDWTQNR